MPSISTISVCVDLAEVVTISPMASTGTVEWSCDLCPGQHGVARDRAGATEAAVDHLCAEHDAVVHYES